MEISLNLTQFGYGVGLVLIGWAAGVAVNFFFDIFRRISFI